MVTNRCSARRWALGSVMARMANFLAWEDGATTRAPRTRGQSPISSCPPSACGARRSPPTLRLLLPTLQIIRPTLQVFHLSLQISRLHRAMGRERRSHHPRQRARCRLRARQHAITPLRPRRRRYPCLLRHRPSLRRPRQGLCRRSRCLRRSPRSRPVNQSQHASPSRLGSRSHPASPRQRRRPSRRKRRATARPVRFPHP